MKIEENYIFSGFGFDVIIPRVLIRTVADEDYPEINMNELKIATVKSILISDSRINGAQLKFLRSTLKFSLATLADIVNVPASTLALWEKAGQALTGLSVGQERVLRLEAINNILEAEREMFNKKVGMVDHFSAENSGQVELKVAAF